MSLSRRTLLVTAALAVSGCAASPAVTGAPAIAPSSPPPTQSAPDAAAQAALVMLRAHAELLSGLDLWPDRPWAAAVVAQCDAHLGVVSLPDPFSADEQEPFVVAEPSLASPDSLEDAEAVLAQLTGDASSALEASAAAAGEGDLRLLHASAATAVTALADRVSAPAAGDATPRRLQLQSISASLPVALGHTWALIYGLGVGLGRLGAKEPLHALGAARLTAVKELRNELRDALGTAAPPQPAAFALPTAMDSPETIRAGWQELERNLLDGYALLVASDEEERWRLRMREQVTPLQGLGAAVTYWPGWVA